MSGAAFQHRLHLREEEVGQVSLGHLPRQEAFDESGDLLPKLRARNASATSCCLILAGQGQSKCT